MEEYLKQIVEELKKQTNYLKFIEIKIDKILEIEDKKEN
jgi:hypothetical protein